MIKLTQLNDREVYVDRHAVVAIASRIIYKQTDRGQPDPVDDPGTEVSEIVFDSGNRVTVKELPDTIVAKFRSHDRHRGV